MIAGRYYAIGFPLAALAVCVQCFRERGFFSRAPSRLGVDSTTAYQSDSVVGAVIALLLSDRQLSGSAAFERVTGYPSDLLGTDTRELFAMRARAEEATVEGLPRVRWRERADLYRVIGELHVIAALGDPLTIERSGDSLVASSDTLRAIGELNEALRLLESAIGRYRAATLASSPDASTFRARMRAKVSTLESSRTAIDSALRELGRDAV